MLNKKNLLGKIPASLGIKDAVHTAIVAVRAGCRIEPGQKCSIDKNREAIPDFKKGCGIADPWRKEINTGDVFWLILNQDEIPNVQHTWEHPSVDFSPPTREVVYNSVLQEEADRLGVTYKQLMDAAQQVIDSDRSTEYPGTIVVDEDEDEFFEIPDMWDFWSSWASETGYEFENNGSACCPEYDYPTTHLFVAKQ